MGAEGSMKLNAGKIYMGSMAQWGPGRRDSRHGVGVPSFCGFKQSPGKISQFLRFPSFCFDLAHFPISFLRGLQTTLESSSHRGEKEEENPFFPAAH